MNETLSRLGFTLQQNFQFWLSHVTLADLDFHTALVDQSTGFDRLTQELVACEQISDAFFEIEAWLTSGFLPGESEAVVVSPEELFAQSPIDRPSWKREERDRHQKPLSATVQRVISDRHPIPETSNPPQPTGQDDFNSASLQQQPITPTVVEPALPHQVEDWTTAGITEPSRTVFPPSQNPLKGMKELATFLQEDRSTQADFSSPVNLEVDRDQATWPLSSNSVTDVNWRALKEDKAIVVAGAGPLNPPILGDFELGEMARLPQDWGLGGESTQADFTSPVNLEVDRDQITWPLSSNSVTDVNWRALKNDEAIVSAMAGPLNPPILGDFELGEMAGRLNSPILEDFEASLAQKSPRIGGLGGDSAGHLNSPILEDFEASPTRKSPRIEGLGGGSAGSVGSISRFDITAQPEVPTIDFDTLLEALQQEINQDYHRFYGS